MRPKLDGVRFKEIGQQHIVRLLGPFTEKEIKDAIWECGSDKTPGPYGINFRFIKEFWEVLKVDVLRFMDEFYVHGSFPKGCNASFITLVPKVKDPQNLHKFRPISLIGCIYKMVSKVLARRLKGVMPLLIDETQSAFIEGTHLLHSAIIANEVIQEAKIRNKPCLVFKVDYKMAYDSVSWEFVLYLLKRMGFCDRWVTWIEGCLKSASISILVNGSPTPEFIPQRGLRQGDPLSPFLFNILVEGPNALVKEAMDKNLFQGFNVGRNEVKVSILQYADDTLFLGKVSMENVKAIKVILRSFELASGFKINFSKSRFGVIGMSDSWEASTASYLNCELVDIPFLYLGIPIGSYPRGSELWDPIVKKCERKLVK